MIGVASHSIYAAILVAFSSFCINNNLLFYNYFCYLYYSTILLLKKLF